MTDTPSNIALEILAQELFRLRHAPYQKIETAACGIGISKGKLSKIEHGKYLSLNIPMIEKLLKHYKKKIKI